MGINRVAEVFSGGVDSAPLAATCHHYLRKQASLVTVGFSRCHDIIFSKWPTSKMGIDHKVYEMNRSDFEENLQRIHELIKCKNPFHIEIAYLFLDMQGCNQNHLNEVLSANGCDELFCGYDKYRGVYDEGKTKITKLTDESISNEFALIAEIKMGSSIRGTDTRTILCGTFIEFAKTIPIGRRSKVLMMN